MKFSVFNLMIKEMVKQLIEGGHDSNSICRVTLGTTSIPLFQRLLDGKVLGHMPLERFLDTFGYELMIIPVKKDDPAGIKEVETKCFDFVRQAKQQLDEYLLNKTTKRGRKPSESKEQIGIVVADILNKIHNT